MFNPTLVVIEAFIRELRTMYERTYGVLEPGFPSVNSFVAQLALENIATSDAAYHDVNHTIMVTLVGREILRGRHISVGGVTPRDWLHFIGQLGDINYLRKLPALFNEFRETGMSDKLDEVLRATYPDFFWKTVRPYI